MLRRRTDLPVDRDGLGRYLPWLIAAMVYLSSLALAAALALHGMARHWETGVGGTLTVQVPPVAGHDLTERLGRATESLRAAPGVIRAEPIPEARAAALLEPWLGATGLTTELPLPRLIEVELAPGARPDGAAVAARLAAVVPEAVVDDHRVWLSRLLRFVRALEGLAATVLSLAGLATVGTVVFTTRTGLAVHQDVIEVLHLIGAHDGYIARQFAERAFALGLRGGIIGFLMAAPTLLAIGWMAGRLAGGFFPRLTLTPGQWLLVALLPLAVAAIATATARLTVNRTLARLP